MRAAFRYISISSPAVKQSWKEVLFRLWFQRRDGKPCVFEHIFLGNLAEDISGQPVAGGFHFWLKFYLEEVRGTATYLGYIYNSPKDGLNNSRFLSGKFVWDYAGFKLVKDQGGFFIGTSPEWQLAAGTVAYFETLTPECAEKNGWVPWAAAYNVGYTKDVAQDGERYRYVICTASAPSEESTKVMSETSILSTTYAVYLGPAVIPEESDMSELDYVCTSAELARKLPRWIVTDGIALHEGSHFSEECVQFCIKRGCRSIGDSLAELRKIFEFSLEDAVAAAKTPGYPRIRALVEDTAEVAHVLLERAERPQPLLEQLPDMLNKLREEQGRRGPRVHQPIRLLLTGRADGVPIADVLALLELAQEQGGDETGVRLRDRLGLAKEIFSKPPFVDKPVAVDTRTSTALTFVN